MNLVSVQDATNFSVPEYVDVVSEMKIIPGCTYEIVVETSPTDGKRNASLNYTVPGRSILEVVSYAFNTLRTGAFKLFKCTFPGSKQFKSTFILCFFKNL